MWVSRNIRDWFKVSHEAYNDLKADNAALRAEVMILKLQAKTNDVNADWLRMRINALELENKALLEKAYDIRLPAPELTRLRPPMPEQEFNFDDIGDVLAKQLATNQFDHKSD